MEELATRYDPIACEDKWYKFWEGRGYFRADENSQQPAFCIVIPPPNITNILHMGHALNNTLQDVIIRWRRMQAYNALWLPGTDHAGIATQHVVERSLWEQHTSREELGREKFMQKVWEWKEKYGNTIIMQLKKLGCSCDWSRLRFTLDEGLSYAVRTAFKRLFDEGLIYKDTYIINWCPSCKTAISDDEVEHRDHHGNLWYIKYPLEEGKGYVVVATTRPETMLGDTAVAANPGDDRYRLLLGKRAILPIINRPLPIIADDFVQPEFGTGLVKVTPAHDPNDYLIGKRHKLEEINILEPDARINENGGPYKGMDRFACRDKLVNDLREMGLIEKIEDYSYSIGHCYRCNTIIEPYISLQWFVKMRPLAEPAIDVVKNGQLRFVPRQWENTYFHWLENVRDWCISRQLWWGHRIPAWYCQNCGGIEVSAAEPPTQCSKCDATELKQDEDVLDTWFSSALWPFSTLGWPAKTKDLEVFYPTSVLVTAHDIIFFWVARMVMMGLKFIGQVPFYEVYINALVYDEHGQKMSKSKGNIIDPLDIIKGYGTDSLRLTLCAYAAQGRNINLSIKRFKGYRNFMNKLWNAARLVLSNTEDLTPEQLAKGLDEASLTLADRWILSCFFRLIQETNNAFQQYEFDMAVSGLYQFLWHQYCDWYLELVKPRLYAVNKPDFDAEKAQSRVNAQIILVKILETLLRLLHPFIPFITEELRQQLKARYESCDGEESNYLVKDTLSALKFDSIMVAPWPEPDGKEWINEQIETTMSFLQRLIYTIRNIRGEMGIPPGVASEVKFASPNSEKLKLVNAFRSYFETLINLETLEVAPAMVEERFASASAVEDVTVIVPLPAELRQREIQRLNKEIEKLEAAYQALAKKLSNANFLSQAPESVVKKEKERFNRINTELRQLKQRIEKLQK